MGRSFRDGFPGLALQKVVSTGVVSEGIVSVGFLMENFSIAILLAVVFWKDYVGIKYRRVIYWRDYLLAGLFTGGIFTGGIIHQWVIYQRDYDWAG